MHISLIFIYYLIKFQPIFNSFFIQNILFRNFLMKMRFYKEGNWFVFYTYEHENKAPLFIFLLKIML